MIQGSNTLDALERSADLKVLFGSILAPFFGVLGSQIDQTQLPETTSKTHQKSGPKKAPKVVLKGSQKGAQIVKIDVLDQSLVAQWSQMVPMAPPASILEPFWEHLGIIFAWFLVRNHTTESVLKATVQTTATTEMKRKLQPRQPRPVSDRTIEALGGTQHYSRKS